MDKEDRHNKWLKREIERMNDRALRRGDQDPYYKRLRGEVLAKHPERIVRPKAPYKKVLSKYIRESINPVKTEPTSSIYEKSEYGKSQGWGIWE